MQRNKLNMCLIFPQINEVSKLMLRQYLSLLRPCSNNLILLTKDGVIKYTEGIGIEPNIDLEIKNIPFLFKLIEFLKLEYNVSNKLIPLMHCNDVIVLTISRGSFLFPQLIAKLFHKKLVLITGGTSSLCIRKVHSDSMFEAALPRIVLLLEKITYQLSDRIVVFSSREIGNKIGLKNYGKKIRCLGSRFVDSSLFKMEKNIQDREPNIGYIGRFAEEKGVRNFLDSISFSSDKSDNIKYTLIGNGPLLPYVEKEVRNYSNITLKGFLPHEELPFYLNRMKLLVIPSYTEGLPNIMMEAMSCGTPVLATPVGAIPDIIVDGKTGFIMADNSAKCISINVIKVLNNPDLELIVKNAKTLIEQRFTYQKAEERYKAIFEDL